MKEKIREFILSYGADLCGFANIDRFNEAPAGFKPTDILPDCKTVISFALALPKGLSKVSPRFIYGYYNNFSCSKVDEIAFKAAVQIEKNFKRSSVPMPCDSPYEYWDKDNMEGRGLLSMKHTAVQAGLGTLGKNTLFMNKHFGNMITLGAILTTLELESDQFDATVCISNCRKCIDACPVSAINNGTVSQKLCRTNTYGKTERGFDTVDCNICRTVCPMNHATP
ncbi:epoxyqueuosine reductase [Oxobacter pfennigii]|uniref:Epoxyqueuosine reductase n=1 Tax=Oxobacter pfennigii TaxID=36849 RepID=A0A0N8NTA9_9CLOT|nr:epoxyqueuosine reductase [Oxobacter pfennigii]KPU44320.1 epoxyqueuosine reductase [Oxobacter pfennigii]